MKRLALFILFITMGAFAAQATAIPDQDKIQSLLNALDKPGISFVRNGETWTGAEAKAHLSEKLKENADKVKTPEDFITVVGTSSSHTGKPYLIKGEDGKIIPAADWFHQQLMIINSRTK